MPYGGDGNVSPCGGDDKVLPYRGDSEVSPCRGDVKVGSVTPDSIAYGKDTKMELLLGSLVSRPTGCIGGKVGSHSSVAASSGIYKVEAIELVDRVGNDYPERQHEGE